MTSIRDRNPGFRGRARLRVLHLALLAGTALTLAPLGAALADSSATSIPLDLIQESYGGGQYGYRLGINVGVNGAQPQEYLFDTGSDLFNIDVGTGNGGYPSWFPNTGARQTAPFAYLYGDGTYGYWETATRVGSVQFYNSATGTQAAAYATPGGMLVATARDWMVAPQSAGGDTLGPAVTVQNGVTLYQDLTWQQKLDQGVPPEEGHFYGTFGAGDFGYGVPGMLTTSGYIVEANGTGKAPGSCGQACLIVGLTPALRAQFLTAVPWIPTNGQTSPFPLSGANSANQFDSTFIYTLTSGGKSVSAAMPTLFDTGTPNILLIDNGDLGLLTAQTQAGNINPYGDLVPGVTLTTTGAVAGAWSSSTTSGNDSQGDYTDVVTLGPYGGFPDGAIYGIGFFMQNAVMYDLANQATGYTPFFISTADLTTSLTVTQDMGPLGLAGTLSGSGPLTVATGGIANLSGTNTYTGATVIAPGGWLGLAGPGSIAQSSGVQADGVFDVSRAGQPSLIQSLSGAGTVMLGANTLELTNASDTFTGQLTDGGLGGGTGGSLIIAGGAETLAGRNTYTGPTGIGPTATLTITGSVAGGVLDAGLLRGTGTVGGTLAMAGGTVAPGMGSSNTGTLTVAGLNSEGAGTLAITYGGTSATQLAVAGNAIVTGMTLSASQAPATTLPTFDQKYVVLTSQTLTGQFTNATTFSNVGTANAQTYQRLRYDLIPNDVVLEVAQTQDWTQGVRNPNAAAVGSLINTNQLNGSDPWMNALDGIYGGSAADRATNLEKVSGEGVVDTYDLSSLVVGKFTNAIGNHMQGIDAGTAESRVVAATANMVARSSLSAQNAANFVASANAMAANGKKGDDSGDDRITTWTQAYYASDRLGAGQVQATRSDAGGVTAGVDARLGEDGPRAGVAIAYAEGDSHTGSLGTKGHGSYWQFGGYASQWMGAWFAGATAGYTTGSIDVTRNVTLNGSGLMVSGTGTSDVGAFNSLIQGGRRIDLDDGWKLTATGGLTVTVINQGGYTERGAGPLNLAMGEVHVGQSWGEGGLRLSRDFQFAEGPDAGRFSPYAGLTEAAQWAGGRVPMAAVGFVGAPAGAGSVATAGATLPGDMTIADAGFSYTAGDDLLVGLGYENTFSVHLHESAVSFSLSKTW